MKIIFLIVQLLFITFFSFGQGKTDKLTQSIVAEGTKLYKSEAASWYGTDVFLAQYKNRENLGGYFSYPTTTGAICIFFSKTDIPKVIGAVSFDSTYKTQSAKLELTERRFTDEELSLFSMRVSALKTIQQDTIFKHYRNTNFNIIPLISNGEKKVYVLTGPQRGDIVIFGNDYFIKFNADNKPIEVKVLHKNIIAVAYGQKDGNEDSGAETMHTHLSATGDFITATDICTLMLYEKIAHWKQHSVISANYLSIWDCRNNQLFMMTKKALDKIDGDQKKRHPAK